MLKLDDTDRRILAQLQIDAAQSLDQLAERVNLSRNAVWRRIRALEQDGVIDRRVAVLNARALGLGLTVFIAVRTDRHDSDWLTRFAKAVRDMPEILGAYRISGDVDYMIRARVADMDGYDALYQQLIRRVPMADVSASFVMEELKETTALPL